MMAGAVARLLCSGNTVPLPVLVRTRPRRLADLRRDTGPRRGANRLIVVSPKAT